MEYRYGSHTVFQIEDHFVWVSKYRYQVLKGEVAERFRELLRQTCEMFEIRIVKGVVSKAHVHILVSAPPPLAPSERMRRMKGQTASYLFEEFPHLKKRYWGQLKWVTLFRQPVGVVKLWAGLLNSTQAARCWERVLK